MKSLWRTEPFHESVRFPWKAAVANHFHQLETFETSETRFLPSEIRYAWYQIWKHFWFFFSQGGICSFHQNGTLWTFASSQPRGTQGRSLVRPLLWCYLASDYNHGALTVKMDQYGSIPVMLRSRLSKRVYIWTKLSQYVGTFDILM